MKKLFSLIKQAWVDIEDIEGFFEFAFGCLVGGFVVYTRNFIDFIAYLGCY